MSDYPWLDWMKEHIGEVEWTGHKPSRFVEDCFKFTSYGPLNGSTPPACAATLCRALEECGYSSSKSAAAMSYATYGMPSDLKKGAIIVFEWADGSHHVSVCYRIFDDMIKCIGGNQGHMIQSRNFGLKWIKAIRWPVKLLDE